MDRVDIKRSESRVGGLAAIGAGIAGIAWAWLELAPQRLGFEDTDSPAVSLAFLRSSPEVYGQAGMALLVLGGLLVAAVLAVQDRLAPEGGSLGIRWATAVGCFAAACLAVFGVLRSGVGPLLYIDGLDRTWGEAGYLVLQVAGIHGVAQAGIMALATWIVAVAAIGVRDGVLPRILAVAAVVPALRLVALLGPLGIGLPEELWIAFMAAIPVSMLWLLVLGVSLLRPRVDERSLNASEASSATA